MRAVAAGALVLCLLTMAFGGLQPSFGEGGGPPEEIGQYQQLGQQQGLTPDHVSWNDGKLKIEGPPLADELRVNLTFVANDLGAWASDTQFTPADGAAVFEGRTATFMPLELGPEPVFTWGDNAQIRFLWRPMWISAAQDEYGGTITLDLEDGDPTGQTLYVSKAWLWERGIHRPNATHEDGTVLNVTRNEDGKGFLVDVHHFSVVEINPAELEVKGRQNGIVFPHVGERRWYSDEARLEIDVGQQLTSYEVLVEADWTVLNLALPVVIDHSLVLTTAKGDEYYSVLLDPETTPTTLIYTVLDCETASQSDPDQCPPFVPDIYAELDIPGDLYFAQFNLTTEELEARVADNPTVPILVRTPQGIAIREVWRVVHRFLYDIADGLHRNETNGVLWIAPSGTEMPVGALECAAQEQVDGDPGNQMPGYDVLVCASEMKHAIFDYCEYTALSPIPKKDLADVAEGWGLDPIGEIYDVLGAVSQPCELLGYVFAWTDLHFLAAAYFLESMDGDSHDPTYVVLPMQPYRGKWATAGGTRKAMEKMEMTFATAGVEFEDTKAPVKFPSGWTQNTWNGLRSFSANYNHDFNGLLSAIMVLRAGEITLGAGEGTANGVVGDIGGATNGWMTWGSWGYANNARGPHARNLWTSHEAGHLFDALHSDAGCWGQHAGWNPRQHQSIMGASSDNDGKQDHCKEWHRAHFHMNFTVYEIGKVRPHACSISIAPCSPPQ